MRKPLMAVAIVACLIMSVVAACSHPAGLDLLRDRALSAGDGVRDRPEVGDQPPAAAGQGSTAGSSGPEIINGRRAISRNSRI